jgi:transcriptional regulator with XRE-family HTH domain
MSGGGGDRVDPGTPGARVIAGGSRHAGGVTDLAEFLRARREHLHPADVGLPDNGRRRTPGLRREEVATLAGVSIDYLVRLEQGRDTHPSPSVLGALAAALRLSDSERMHLGKLAAKGSAPGLCPSTSALVHDVAPTLTLLLDQLDPTPAFIAGPSNNVLAWNRSWERLVRPLGLFDEQVPNLAHHVFLHPRATTIYPDWSAVADAQVSRLRSAVARWGDDGGFVALMSELQGLPEFDRRWSTHDVGEASRGVQRLAHPDVGDLRLAYEVLLLPHDGDQRLVTWLPDSDATAAALSVTFGDVPVSPAQLRVVGGP